jgi:hypothetical protein
MKKITLDQAVKAGEYAYMLGIKDCESAHDWIDWLFADGDICHLDKPRIAAYYNSGHKRYAVILKDYQV